MRLKVDGKQLKDSVVFGAGMLPISEFPAKTERDSEDAKTNADGQVLYSVPNLLAIDPTEQRQLRNVFVSITAPDKQSPLTAGKHFVPAGEAIINTYVIDGRELITFECSHLVEVAPAAPAGDSK
ncbi:hypothetical protein [Nesterenkonia aerolata]|uniref:Uncharacterized protein n=1 Tax=Nesterenkonia aerolata TaxID=3074079 RepID=A0ABU2DSC6_9MICC|nr:hypothetical protein [Nesterenkonia sp. LY-0111]MDR8019413.1 hypothetical protein [Nesterenkonia sp. LY-0111]